LNRDTLGSLSEATDAKKRTVAADVREAAGYFVSDAILDVSTEAISREKN
jgi:hypothetical protein